MSDKTNNSETYFSRKATIQVLCVRMSILLRETHNINHSSRDTNEAYLTKSMIKLRQICEYRESIWGRCG